MVDNLLLIWERVRNEKIENGGRRSSIEWECGVFSERVMDALCSMCHGEVRDGLSCKLDG